MKKTVIGIIIGVLLAFTLDVAAETLIDSGAVTYSNSKTAETTVDGALDELFSAIDISKQIGDMTKIATLGDGTITGAISSNSTKISELQTNITTMNNNISQKGVITQLFKGELKATTNNTTVSASLSDNISNYDMIFVDVYQGGSSFSLIFMPAYESTHYKAHTTYVSASFYSLVYVSLTSNQVRLNVSAIGWTPDIYSVRNVVGIKF